MGRELAVMLPIRLVLITRNRYKMSDWKRFTRKSLVAQRLGHEATIKEDVTRETRPRDNVFFFALTDEGQSSLRVMVQNAILENQWQQASTDYKRGIKPTDSDYTSPISWQEGLYEMINLSPIKGAYYLI